MSTKKSDAIRYLEKLTGASRDAGALLEAVPARRRADAARVAEKLGLSRSRI